jgi:cell fate regulator YaaT (PSP1 superfamily)
MMDKMKDEYEALMICRDKVAQRGLPMNVVDAEYQWRVTIFYL